MGVTRRPNGQWRARVIGDDGRERAKHFTTKALAKRWEAEQVAALVNGRWVDPSDTTTVVQYARTWAAARPHRPSTARRVEAAIEHHVAATRLGDRRIAAVRPSEIQAWAMERAQHLAPSTMKNLVSLVRSVFVSAALDRVIGTNPVGRIKLADHRAERVVPLTVQQVRSLMAAVPRINRAMIVTQAGLGLRIGELLALRVQDVNFLGRTARIEFQRSQDTRDLVPPKTLRSRRTVPLPNVVSEALAAHLAEFGPGNDSSIFADDSGRPWNHVRVQRIFKFAVRAAHLPPGTTPHDLRHAYASWLLDAGESVVTVADRLGHENASMVITTYAHIIADREDRTRRAIDAVWGSDPDQNRTASE